MILWLCPSSVPEPDCCTDVKIPHDHNTMLTTWTLLMCMNLTVRHKLHHWLCDTSSTIDCATQASSLTVRYKLCQPGTWLHNLFRWTTGPSWGWLLSLGQTFSRLPEEAPQLTLGTNCESRDVGWLALARAPHSKGRLHRFFVPRASFSPLSLQKEVSPSQLKPALLSLPAII